MEIVFSNKNSQLCYIPNVITDMECDTIKKISIQYDANATNEPHLLYHPPMISQGKMKRQHRSVGFFVNETVQCDYGGQVLVNQKMPDYMSDITDRVNDIFNAGGIETNFNAVVFNNYADGEEHIKAHTDSQSGMNNHIVAAISVGEPRTFRVRDRHTNEIIVDVPTYEKGMLIMMGDFQEHYTHEIPIEKQIKSPRWSLTFREL